MRKRKENDERTSPDLYQGLFGEAFGLESPFRGAGDAGTPYKLSSPLASRSLVRTPKMQPRTGDPVSCMSVSPQRTAVPGHASEVHFLPPQPPKLEQQARRASPLKRRRMDMSEPFVFPGPPQRSPSGRLVNGSIASSLARDLRLSDGPPNHLMRAPAVPASRHARFASTSSIPDRQRDPSYVPVHSYDPPPRDMPGAGWEEVHGGRHAYSQSLSNVPIEAQAPVSYARGSHAPGAMPDMARAPHAEFDAPMPRRAHTDRPKPSAEKVWGIHSNARAHRRSVSHSNLDTPVPVSHDRSSSIITPPSESPVAPVTPKSLGNAFSYSDLPGTSPSPLPRRTRQRLPESISFPPKASRHLRLRSEDLGARAARPLWAQSPYPPPSPSSVRM